MKKPILFLLTLLFSLRMLAVVPTIIQEDNAGMVNNGQSMAKWSIWLPDKVPTGNSILCFYKHDAGTAITTTLSDDQSNTWTNIVELQDTANVPTITIGAKIALVTASNPQKITIALSTAEPNVHLMCEDIAFVGSVHTSATGGPAAGPTVATSAITTTSANELIVQYIFNDGISTTPSITVGSGFSKLGTNPTLGHSSQFQVKTSAGSITPTMTANSDFWDTIAVALNLDATKGSDFAAGIRIRCLARYHFEHEGTSTTDSTPAPCALGSGPNLLVAGFSSDSATVGVSSTTDSDSNTYTALSTSGCGSAANLYPQVFYKDNATFSSSNTRTISFTHDTGSPSNVMLFYVEKAGNPAFDTKACPAQASQGAPGNLVCDGTPSNSKTSVSITPSTANGLIIFIENNGLGPECNAVGTGDTANPDMTWFCTVSACNSGGQNDTTVDMEASSGFAHIYNTAASSRTVTWWFSNIANTGTGTNVVNLAVAFKGASTGPPANQFPRIIGKFIDTYADYLRIFAFVFFSLGAALVGGTRP